MRKLLTAAAMAALLAGSLGLAGLVPAEAQDATAAPQAAPAPAAPPDQPATPGAGNHWAGKPGVPGGPWGRPGGMQRFGGMRGNLFAIACGDRGAEALEIALVRAKYALQLTATQQPLFAALQTTALNDQKNFADTCKAAIGDAGAGSAGQPDMLGRLQTRLALETARVAALNDVLPKFKALYDTLSDQQKQALQPRHWGMRLGFNQQGPGWQPGMRQHFGHGQRPWMNGPAQTSPADMPGTPTDDDGGDATAPDTQS